MAVTIIRAETLGRVFKNSAVYATAHNAATGAAGEFDSIIVRNSSGYSIYRGFVRFLTSDLGNISKVRFFFTSNARNEDDAGQATLHIVEGVQDVPLAADDYGDHLNKITSGGSVAFADTGSFPTAGGQNTITLNATGRGWIAATTKFCLRLAGDIDSSVPTGSNQVLLDRTSAFPGVVSDAATSITINSATLNGTSHGSKGTPPLLEITHDGSNPTYPRCRFEYGKTTSYGTETDWQSGIAVFGAFSAAISGLDATTVYHFRAVLEDADGTENGDDAEFTTSSSLVRVTALVIHWSAGPNAIYQEEILTGGLFSQYFSPVSPIKEPEATLPELVQNRQPARDILSRMVPTLREYGQWLATHAQAEQRAILRGIPGADVLTLRVWQEWVVGRRSMGKDI